MRLRRLLAVIIVTFFIGSNALAALQVPSILRAKGTRNTLQIPSFLRPKDTEAVPYLISSWIKKLQLTWWVEVGKPGKEVEPDDALLDASRKAESKQLGTWLRQGMSTYDAWVKLGLNKVPLIEIYKSPVFDTYARYVKMFDDFVIAKIKAGAKHPVIISRDTTPEEMSTRVVIWASLQRSEHYVKLALGLTNLRGTNLTTHVGYKYYEMFLTAIKEMKKYRK